MGSANELWADMEKVLLGLGALQHNDARLKRKDEDAEADQPKRSIFQSSKKKEDDDDSDWD